MTPPTYEAELVPGQTVHVTKTVDVPDVPHKLDFLLLIDITGSYTDDLPVMKRLAPGIFDAIRNVNPFSRFALATHVDFPFGSWGAGFSGCNDYAYRLDLQLSRVRAEWVGAIDALRTRCGSDLPESQYEALYQSVTGAGREIPTTTDGDWDDLGEVPPGQHITFRPGATKVIAFTTDAAFHQPGDPGGPFPYPGPSRDQTIDALKLAGVRVVAIKAPGTTTQMDDVAAQTGGRVVTTSSTSQEIADAILEGLENLKFQVTTLLPDCSPVDIVMTPDRHNDIEGGTSVTFDEALSVPVDVTAADLPPDGIVRCTVKFKASGSLIGRQELTIKVLARPPDCSAVQADPSLLTPPNHSFRLVTLSGATDPDGDPVTLSVTGVTQDEPLDGAGDGSTLADARPGESTESVFLRAERSALGDGRVYQVAFEASDGRGGRCTGSLPVSVPHNRSATSAVDSGQTTNSFGS